MSINRDKSTVNNLAKENIVENLSNNIRIDGRKVKKLHFLPGPRFKKCLKILKELPAVDFSHKSLQHEDKLDKLKVENYQLRTSAIFC